MSLCDVDGLADSRASVVNRFLVQPTGNGIEIDEVVDGGLPAAPARG